MVKVRIQLQGEGTGQGLQTNPFSVARRIIAEDGFFSMYRGLSAAIFRQLTYGTTRLGVFRTLTNRFMPEGGTAADIPMLQRMGMSLCAGGIGALIGTPGDASLVRMQADSVLPREQQRGYKNVFDALFRMFREEGIGGVFKGASPTVIRGLAINVGMLCTYDPVFAKLKDNTPLGDYPQANRFVSGAISGWTAATVSLPADFIKTRIQKQKPDPITGEMPYKGFFDCAMKVARTEGPLAFYNGYATFVVRITPHIMLTWVFMDNFKIAFNKMGI